MCTYIATRGAEESNLFNYVFTVGKLVTLVVIILVAFMYFDINNFYPFTVPEMGYEGTL
jgi:amino acid transporter